MPFSFSLESHNAHPKKDRAILPHQVQQNVGILHMNNPNIPGCTTCRWNATPQSICVVAHRRCSTPTPGKISVQGPSKLSLKLLPPRKNVIVKHPFDQSQLDATVKTRRSSSTDDVLPWRICSSGLDDPCCHELLDLRSHISVLKRLGADKKGGRVGARVRGAS